MKNFFNSLLLILMLMWCIHETTAHKKATYVEIPEQADLNGTSYTISHLTPKFFLRTSNFIINATKCLHYSFKLLERRVKLQSYTCLMEEGGFCSMDKFVFPEDREGCTYMRPWRLDAAEWHFYFNIERRPRVYGPNYEKRIREGKIKRQIYASKKELSTKPIGYLTLYGVVDCDQVCLGNIEETKLGSYSDGTFHKGKYHRLN